MHNFNLKELFDVIVGIDNQESLSKADTINIALEKISFDDKSKVVLISDSMYDAEGAENVNIDFFGVTYGFGFNVENKPKYIIETIYELLFNPKSDFVRNV